MTSIWLMLGSLLTVLAVDQVVKAAVCRRLHVGESVRTRFFRIARAQNRGPGWLALSSARALALWVLALVSVLVVVIAGADLNAEFVAGAGLALGGAASNMIDRLSRKAVVDYIGIGRWPLFNLADVGLTVGVLLTPLALL